MIKKIIRYINSPGFIALAFVLVIIVMGLGRVARWDLLDQVSMADNFLNWGSLYPVFNDPTPHGVSVYFPGVSLILVVLMQVGFDFYLVEAAILISCSILLIFFYVQKKVAEQISGDKILWRQFVPFIVAFSLLVTPDYLKYAVEFKPDTIALVTSYLGLSVAGFLTKKVTLPRIIMGAFLFVGAIIFKQQYIAFIAGVLLYCCFFPSKSRFLFMLFSISFLAITLWLLFLNPNIWFWNVEVLADDGFLGILEVIKLQDDAFKRVIFAVIFCFSSVILAKKVFPIYNREYRDRILVTPWVWGVVFFIISAFLSALKIGGNAGTQSLECFF